MHYNWSEVYEIEPLIMYYGIMQIMVFNKTDGKVFLIFFLQPWRMEF